MEPGGVRQAAEAMTKRQLQQKLQSVFRNLLRADNVADTPRLSWFTDDDVGAAFKAAIDCWMCVPASGASAVLAANALAHVIRFHGMALSELVVQQAADAPPIPASLMLEGVLSTKLSSVASAMATADGAAKPLILSNLQACGAVLDALLRSRPTLLPRPGSAPELLAAVVGIVNSNAAAKGAEGAKQRSSVLDSLGRGAVEVAVQALQALCSGPASAPALTDCALQLAELGCLDGKLPLGLRLGARAVVVHLFKVAEGMVPVDLLKLLARPVCSDQEASRSTELGGSDILPLLRQGLEEEGLKLRADGTFQEGKRAKPAGDSPESSRKRRLASAGMLGLDIGPEGARLCALVQEFQAVSISGTEVTALGRARREKLRADADKAIEVAEDLQAMLRAEAGTDLVKVIMLLSTAAEEVEAHAPEVARHLQQVAVMAQVALATLSLTASPEGALSTTMQGPSAGRIQVLDTQQVLAGVAQDIIVKVSDLLVAANEMARRARAGEEIIGELVNARAVAVRAAAAAFALGLVGSPLYTASLQQSAAACAQLAIYLDRLARIGMDHALLMKQWVARALHELEILHHAADALFNASYLRWLQLARPALVGLGNNAHAVELLRHVPELSGNTGVASTDIDIDSGALLERLQKVSFGSLKWLEENMLPPNTETLAAVMAGRGLNFGAATTCTLSMAVPRSFSWTARQAAASLTPGNLDLALDVAKGLLGACSSADASPELQSVLSEHVLPLLHATVHVGRTHRLLSGAAQGALAVGFGQVLAAQQTYNASAQILGSVRKERASTMEVEARAGAISQYDIVRRIAPGADQALLGARLTELSAERCRALLAPDNTELQDRIEGLLRDVQNGNLEGALWLRAAM